MEMPRYLIVRTFEIDEEAMPDVGRRSKEIRSGGVPRSPRRGRRGQRDKRADLPTPLVSIHLETRWNTGRSIFPVTW
jgi:hypothetical protein